MMIIQQLLRRDVGRTIRNVTAQVNGCPTMAGSTATGGSQTVTITVCESAIKRKANDGHEQYAPSESETAPQLHRPME